MSKENGYSGEKEKSNGLGGRHFSPYLDTEKGKTALQPVDKDEEEDPWKVTSIEQDYTPWGDLDQNGKLKRVGGYILKTIFVLGFLYLFICSLDFLSSAFRLLGGEAAGRVFQRNDIMKNPVAGLMMGVLVTVLVQSSSTSTSIIVSMVGSHILGIKTAIPIVMGANIGTSVTNTIVAIGQISDKGEFRRAFAGATVHDMFNWLTVIVLLPIEVATDFLYHASKGIVDALNVETDEGAEQDILKKITEPFTKKIIQVNKKAITNIAKDVETKYDYESTILKICCDKPNVDKCCNKDFDSNLETTVNKYSFSASERTLHCQEMADHCLAAQPEWDRNIPGCEAIPWGTESSSITLKGDFLDCQSFSSDAAEVACCDNRMDAFLASLNNGYGDDSLTTANQAAACSSVSSCFSATNFLTECSTSSLINTELNVTRDTSTFDCEQWTKNVVNNTCLDKCDYLFRGLHPIGDKAIGAILLIISLGILCGCLVAIVKLLHSLLRGPIAIFIKKFVNAEFPGPLKYLTGYIAILVGAGLTIVVQSSSIFTSTMTPLVGIGVIELDRMFPLTLGSNIGTTTTAILSALTNSGQELKDTLQVAFCHLLFNISGILIFYPLSFMRFPIPLAKFLGNTTAKYRWFAIVYIILMFFLFPLIVFALSIPGWYVLLAVGGPVLVVLIMIAILKVLQKKAPQCLPVKLRDFKWLPLPMRSLAPYDNTMKKIFRCARFQDEEPEPQRIGNGGHSNLGYESDRNRNGGVNATRL